jgi:hypothetical protein
MCGFEYLPSFSVTEMTGNELKHDASEKEALLFELENVRKRRQDCFNRRELDLVRRLTRTMEFIKKRLKELD